MKVTAIFCEDLREEMHGKISAMGLLAGTIYVSQFPAAINLCINVKMELTKDDTVGAKRFLKLNTGGNGTQEFECTISGSPHEGDISYFNVVMRPIPLGAPNSISLYFKDSPTSEYVLIDELQITTEDNLPKAKAVLNFEEISATLNPINHTGKKPKSAIKKKK